MAATAQQLENPENRNRSRPDPVITYDHISDTEYYREYSSPKKMVVISYWHLVSESILLAGLLTALMWLS